MHDADLPSSPCVTQEGRERRYTQQDGTRRSGLGAVVSRLGKGEHTIVRKGENVIRERRIWRRGKGR